MNPLLLRKFYYLRTVFSILSILQLHLFSAYDFVQDNIDEYVSLEKNIHNSNFGFFSYEKRQDLGTNFVDLLQENSQEVIFESKSTKFDRQITYFRVKKRKTQVHRGPRGHRGHRGNRGRTGAQGPQGDPGEKGSQGSRGPTGERGALGPTGPTGGVSLIAIGGADANSAELPPDPPKQLFTVTTEIPTLDSRVTNYGNLAVAPSSDFSFSLDPYPHFVVSSTGGGTYLILYGITAEGGDGLISEMNRTPLSIQAWVEVSWKPYQGSEVIIVAVPIARTKSLDNNPYSGVNREWLSGFGQTQMRLGPGDEISLFVHLADSSEAVPANTSLSIYAANSVIGGSQVDCGGTISLVKIPS